MTATAPVCWYCKEPSTEENAILYDPSVLDYTCARCRADFDRALSASASSSGPVKRLQVWNCTAETTALMDAFVRLAGNRETFLRVIVGFPMVRPSEAAYWEERRLYLVAPGCWRHIARCITGIRDVHTLRFNLEPFGNEEDHREILEAFLDHRTELTELVPSEVSE